VNPNATQGFIWKEITWSPGLLARKQSCLFRHYFFMFTLTWITEKELERVIESKGGEFGRKRNMNIESGGEKLTSASGQQGENERQ